MSACLNAAAPFPIGIPLSPPEFAWNAGAREVLLMLPMLLAKAMVRCAVV